MAGYDPRDRNQDGSIGWGELMGGSGEGGGLSQLNPFGGNFMGGAMNRSSQYGTVDPSGEIGGQAYASGQFAGMGEGGYGAMTREMGRDREYLRGLQRGQNSVSAEQFRQGLQQQYGQMQSMAASAPPGSAPMAARTAMLGASRAGSAMAGNAALAGIQERNAAASQLASLNQAQRQQDLQAALGARSNALQGYGQLEQARTQRYMADMGVPSQGERLLGAGAALGSAYMLKSDRRAKTDIKDASEGAAKLLTGLKAYSYKYKDEKDGKGEQLGIMAQDLERVAPSTVIDTPKGKMVHGARLAAALAAALPGLDKRLSKLEGK